MHGTAGRGFEYPVIGQRQCFAQVTRQHTAPWRGGWQRGDGGKPGPLGVAPCPVAVKGVGHIGNGRVLVQAVLPHQFQGKGKIFFRGSGGIFGNYPFGIQPLFDQVVPHGLPFRHPLVAPLPAAGHHQHIGMGHRIFVGLVQPEAQQRAGFVTPQSGSQHDDGLFLAGGRVGIPAHRHKAHQQRVHDASDHQNPPDDAPRCGGMKPPVQGSLPDGIDGQHRSQQPHHQVSHIEIGGNCQPDGIHNQRRRQAIEQHLEHFTCKFHHRPRTRKHNRAHSGCGRRYRQWWQSCTGCAG